MKIKHNAKIGFSFFLSCIYIEKENNLESNDLSNGPLTFCFQYTPK